MMLMMQGVMKTMHAERENSSLFFFQANAATRPLNIKKFVCSGIDGLIFCSVRWEIIKKFLALMPSHPPIVICACEPLSEYRRRLLGNGGTVMLDNAFIGARVADFYIDHGLLNFAFLSSRVCREHYAGEVRCKAFRERLEERLGAQMMSFSKNVTGYVDDNEDYFDTAPNDLVKWIDSLPRPCGIFVNGDREAYNLLHLCKRSGIDVPKHLEVVSINNSLGLCEDSSPTLTSVQPDIMVCGRMAVGMVFKLAANPALSAEWRDVRVRNIKFVERGSTAGGRVYGHIMAKVREYIRLNAYNPIRVSDIVDHVGISRRMLEMRVHEATGGGLLAMIRIVRMEKVRRLLETTDLPISEVTMQAGYELTSNLGRLFREMHGMSMREYREASKKT